MPRRAARVDANHLDIVRALRDVGTSVCSLASVGHGVPDLLIGMSGLTLVGRFNPQVVRWLLKREEDIAIYDGANLLMEVKDGAKSPSAQILTPDEQKWHQEWQGQLMVVRTIDEALRAVGVLHAWGGQDDD